MKSHVYVDIDSLFPVFFIRDVPFEGQISSELDEEDVRAIAEAEKSWRYWQVFLENKFREADAQRQQSKNTDGPLESAAISGATFV